MLTVDQIKEVTFKRASIGGYRSDEVDAFIDRVAETVEELKKKNAEIIAKSELLMKKVEEYRSDEDSVSQVMLKAQREADKTLKDAKKTAAQIVKDARAEAERIVSDASARIIREKEMIVQIEEEAAEIRKKLIEEFEHQIESLKVLPDESEPKALKKSLDERYPTEAPKSKKDAESANDKSEDGFTTIEEAVEDATAATEDSANAEAAAQPESKPAAKAEPKAEAKTDGETADEEAAPETDSKDGTIQIDKSKFETRFGRLKFGEDYDVKKAE